MLRGLKRFEIGTIADTEDYDLRVDTVTAENFTMSGAGTMDVSSGTLIMAAGTVQNVEGTSATPNTTTTASYVVVASDTITTSAGPGPVLVIATFPILGATGATCWADVDLRRDTTVLVEHLGAFKQLDADATDGPSIQIGTTLTFMWLDSSATASTTHTYEVRIKNNAGAGANCTYGASAATITAMEFRND